MTTNSVIQGLDAHDRQALLISRLLAVPGVTLVHDEILCATTEAATAVQKILGGDQP